MSIVIKKVMIVIGTRPEAIKMVPVIRRLNRPGSPLEPRICITAQHREMLDQVLDHFHIVPDYDLDIMTPGQDIFDLTLGIMSRLKPVLEKEVPDMVMVHGDTTTAFAASLAAFYKHIPVAHVEAGLRTHRKDSPFPEEINRHLIGVIGDYHFAPTNKARGNLLAENVKGKRIWVTGNTVIDTLLQEVEGDGEQYQSYFEKELGILLSAKERKTILVTGHRRESFGRGFQQICLALKQIALAHPEVSIVYPVHLNPNVRQPVNDILGNGKYKNVHLIDPLEYPLFVYLMQQSYLILTDSGGIQEEGPSLGKPVLVMRDTTERPEGIAAGTCRLVGTGTAGIVREVERLLTDRGAYETMANAVNPYGDGMAAERIVSVLSDVMTDSVRSSI